MPTAPAKPEGRRSSAAVARPWKWTASWLGYSAANKINQAMKVPTTMLNSVSREKRCVAKLYTTCEFHNFECGRVPGRGAGGQVSAVAVD